MTKPAAVFMQILGVFVVLIAIGAQSWLIAFAGIGMLVWGGAVTRAKMRQGS